MRRMGKPAGGGKSLPDIARWAILCRAASDQLLENAAAPVWPSSCNFRRVAALALPPSLLAQNVRVSTSGAASRLTAGQTPVAAATAAADGMFPELLAGLVAANGAEAGPLIGCCAASPATSSDAAPRPDTPAGIETLLKEILAAPHGATAALVEGAAARPAAKREPAARRASSPAPSGTAPKVAASKPEPDPAPLAAGQTNSAIQIRPTYIIAAMLGDLSGESGVQPNGQTASVAALPPQIVYAGHPPNAPMAMPRSEEHTSELQSL